MWNVSHELEFEHLALFGKVMEPLGDGALLKEVCYWVWALKSYSLAPLAALPLSPECKYNAFRQPPAPAIKLFWLPKLYPSVIGNQKKPRPPFP